MLHPLMPSQVNLSCKDIKDCKSFVQHASAHILQSRYACTVNMLERYLPTSFLNCHSTCLPAAPQSCISTQKNTMLSHKLVQKSLAGSASKHGPIKGASPDQLQPLKIQKPKGSPQWALAESDFEEGVVGGKSGNLAKLRGVLPDWINVPTSVAIPFGSCERVLKDKANAEVAKAIQTAQKELVGQPNQACMISFSTSLDFWVGICMKLKSGKQDWSV